MSDKKTPQRFSESFMYIQELFQTDESKPASLKTKLITSLRIIGILLVVILIIAFVCSAILLDLSGIVLSEGSLVIPLRHDSP